MNKKLNREPIVRITIKIGGETAKHLSSPHTFCESCGETETVMKKIQKEIDKYLRRKGSR